VLPGELYFDSKKKAEIVAQYHFSYFESRVAGCCIELVCGHGYLTLLYPHPEDSDILREFAEHLNELAGSSSDNR
jgi:hypothetical protein